MRGLPLCQVSKIYSSGPCFGLITFLKVVKTPCQAGHSGGAGNWGRTADPTCPLGWVSSWGLRLPELHWVGTEHTQPWEEEGEPWESGLVRQV